MIRLLVLPCIFLTLLPASAQQSTKRAMTFADLMAMKRVSDPQISPSGKWVLFSVTDVSLEANTRTNHLWVLSLDGSSNAADGNRERQLTTGKGESNGRFSPDGKRISWTADDSDGTSQIFLADWHESDASLGTAMQLTRLSTGADGAIWSPDSQHLLVTSSVYPECSTEEGVQKSRAALASPEASLADRVGDAPKPGTLGRVSQMVNSNLIPAAWSDEASCNKARDDAAAKDPVKAQIWTSLLYRHWNQYTGEKRSHILLVSANDSDAVRDLTPASNVGTAETPTFFVSGPLGYAWAPDSKEIAYVTNLDQVPASSTNNDIFTLAIDAPADNQQFRTTTKPTKISTSPGSDDAPQYSPDGKYLAFRSQARAGFESDRFRLMLHNRRTNNTQELLPHWDGSVDEFRWGPRSAIILFTTEAKGAAPINAVSVEEESPGVHEMRTLPETGEFSDIQISKSYTIIASHVSVRQPTEIIRIESLPPNAQGVLPARPDLATLSHLNEPILSQLSLAPLEPFWFEGANGTRVEGFLLRPPNFDPNRKYPLKFLMHGGPQTAWGDGWSYRWNWQLMAASGYVVIGVNRRGSTGYGQKFVDEVSGDWGGRAYQDLMLGLDYAEQHSPFIDKSRECALGASYGGFMADWVLTHTDRFKCIVTHDGLSDPESAFGTTEELWFPEWEFRPLAAKGTSGKAASTPEASRRGSEADTVVEQTQPSFPWDFYDKPNSQNPYRRWSAMLAIRNAKTPTLIIHSQRDYRLDVSQGLELFTALQLRGIPSKFLYFPDEGHWVLKPKNSELWNATVSDWCDRWTRSNKYATSAVDR